MIETLTSALQDMLTQAQNWLQGMTSPWRLAQIGILLALWGLSHVITRRYLDGALRAGMHKIKGLNKGQLRFLVTVQRRSRSILFVLLAFAVVGVMREVTWPSRSYLIGLVATFVAAVTVVAIATRLIKNPLLRSLVQYAAWGWVTLTLLGLWDDTVGILDHASIQLGGLSLSALLVAKTVLLLAVLLSLASWASRFSASRLKQVDDLSPSMRVLAEKMVTIGLYGIAVVFTVRSVGFDLTSLTVLSGAIGIGVGFGLQKVVSNFVSGFILLLDKSIKPGDVISLGDTFGWIQSLSARYVSVVTRDGREYLIPNEDLITGQVVNWSHSDDLVRLDIDFGVSYDSDPHHVRKIAVEACRDIERVQQKPAPVCHVVGFGDSSIDLKLRIWISDPSGGLTNVRGQVFLALWDTLKENNVEIPFPRRDVTLLNDTPQLPSD